MTHTKRTLALFASIAVLLTASLLLIPRVEQNPLYHAFADQRTLVGIPNFWNVISNVPFLLAALYGLTALRPKSPAFVDTWERVAYCTLLAGTAAVAIGSDYYHLQPDNQTLFWDRLPMTVVFMSLVATTLGERIGTNVGKWSLTPLILLGIGSVIDWRWTGDLRLYGLVQFGSMLIIPALVALYPPRYSGSERLWFLVAFYGLAKLAELFDHQIGTVIATGGHPWKHLAAACAIFFYMKAVADRVPLSQDLNPAPAAIPAQPGPV